MWAITDQIFDSFNLLLRCSVVYLKLLKKWCCFYKLIYFLIFLLLHSSLHPVPRFSSFETSIQWQHHILQTDDQRNEEYRSQIYQISLSVSSNRHFPTFIGLSTTFLYNSTSSHLPVLFYLNIIFVLPGKYQDVFLCTYVSEFFGSNVPYPHSTDPVSLKMKICGWQTAGMVHIIHYLSVENNTVLGSTNLFSLTEKFLQNTDHPRLNPCIIVLSVYTVSAIWFTSSYSCF